MVGSEIVGGGNVPKPLNLIVFEKFIAKLQKHL
jgi:hypothetical protein